MKPEIVDNFVENFWNYLKRYEKDKDIQKVIIAKNGANNIEHVKNVWKLYILSNFLDDVNDNRFIIFSGRAFFQLVVLQCDIYGLKISSWRTMQLLIESGYGVLSALTQNLLFNIYKILLVAYTIVNTYVLYDISENNGMVILFQLIYLMVAISVCLDHKLFSRRFVPLSGLQIVVSWIIIALSVVMLILGYDQ